MGRYIFVMVDGVRERYKRFGKIEWKFPLAIMIVTMAAMVWALIEEFGYLSYPWWLLGL
jgi:hypothetical protein